MSMEIAQLCKSAYNNQLQQAIYLCHQKKRCLKYGRCIQFGRAKRSNQDAHIHPLTGFEINKNLPVHNQQKYLQVKKIKNKYQFPTPYGCRDIARTRFYRSRSLRQGQRSNQGHTITLHTYNPNQCPYQVSTSYTLPFPRYSKLKVTAARSNQGHTMTLHTYTTQPMSLPSINFLHLMVSEIQPRQTFSRCSPARPSGHHG